MRNRREVRRIRLDQQPVARYQPQQIVIRPFLERDDAAERDVPPGIDRKSSEIDGAGITMQYADYTCSARFTNDGARVVFGIASVHDDRLSNFLRQLHLRREGRALRIAR